MNVAVVTTKAVGGQTTQAVGVLLGIQGLSGKSAYQSAVDGGYTGTESDFNTLFAGLGDISAALDAIVG